MLDKSKIDTSRDHLGGVAESLPFLDLLVIRYRDADTNALSHKSAIYRKPSNVGAYIHSLSSQPTATKRAVIRSMFLRAYRYCDNLFLEEEERRIYTDFERLGYSKKFITKAKVSAHRIETQRCHRQSTPQHTRQIFHLQTHRSCRRMPNGDRQSRCTVQI